MAKTQPKQQPKSDLRLVQEQLEVIQKQLHHNHEMLHAIVKGNAAILKHLAGGMTPAEAKQVTDHMESVSAKLKGYATEPIT